MRCWCCVGLQVHACREAVAAAEAHLQALLPKLAAAAGVRSCSYVTIQNQGTYLVELPADFARVPAGWEKVGRRVHLVAHDAGAATWPTLHTPACGGRCLFSKLFGCSCATQAEGRHNKHTTKGCLHPRLADSVLTI